MWWYTSVSLCVTALAEGMWYGRLHCPSSLFFRCLLFRLYALVRNPSSSLYCGYVLSSHVLEVRNFPCVCYVLVMRWLWTSFKLLYVVISYLEWATIINHEIWSTVMIMMEHTHHNNDCSKRLILSSIPKLMPFILIKHHGNATLIFRLLACLSYFIS